MIRLSSLARRLAALLVDRRAATAVEYGLICAMIVLAMLVSLRAAANGTISIWSGISLNIVGAR